MSLKFCPNKYGEFNFYLNNGLVKPLVVVERYSYLEKKIEKLREAIEHLNEGVKCTGFKNALEDAKMCMRAQDKKIDSLTKLLESVNSHASNCDIDKGCTCYYDKIVKALADETGNTIGGIDGNI